MTAVIWLKKQLEDYGSPSHLSLDWDTFDELCQQAKEMEKEQIMEARIDGDTWSTAIKEMRAKYAELYYNETYGGNK